MVMLEQRIRILRRKIFEVCLEKMGFRFYKMYSCKYSYFFILFPGNMYHCKLPKICPQRRGERESRSIVGWNLLTNVMKNFLGKNFHFCGMKTLKPSILQTLPEIFLLCFSMFFPSKLIFLRKVWWCNGLLLEHENDLWEKPFPEVSVANWYWQV